MISSQVKRLRTNMTDAERKLWRALRSRGLAAKFRRQVPLGPYIVDFVCFETKTIVEVDGGQHATSKADARRDAYFEQRGYRVQRFWNHDVLGNLDGVVATLIGDFPSDAPESCLSGHDARTEAEAVPSPLEGEGVTKSTKREDG